MILRDDDVPFRFLNAWKQILGKKNGWIMLGAFQEYLTVDRRVPCIMCCNKDPRYKLQNGLDYEDLDWLNINCIFYKVTSRIFTLT